MATFAIEKLPHQKCGTSDALQVWYDDESDKYTGFCFKCEDYFDNPYNEERPKPDVKSLGEKQKEELNEIKGYPLLEEDHRGVPAQFWAHFKVRQWFCTETGKSRGVAFPFSSKNGKALAAFKSKLLEKNPQGKKIMWSTGDMKNAEPFGWAQAITTQGNTLYITEGEEDAVALTYCLSEFATGGKYKGKKSAVISLKSGASSAKKQLQPFLKEIKNRFKKVVLCFDMDEAGEKAVSEVRKILPDAYRAVMPAKDANDCIQKGLGAQLFESVLFKSSVPSNSKVVDLETTFIEALTPPERGVDYPWPSLTNTMYGQRKTDLLAWGGGTGLGKTKCMYELVTHNIIQHKWVNFCVMMEALPTEVIHNLAGVLDDITYWIPNTPFNKERFRHSFDRLKGGLVLWDNTQATDPYSNWKGIKNRVDEMSDEIDTLTIDNITTLAEGLTPTEKNDFIGTVASECIQLISKFNIQINLLSHLNPPEKGKRPHENGGVVHESQFTGSRALQRYCHGMFGFERNKMAVDPSCSKIRVLKNRRFGTTGWFKTYYNLQTGRLQEFDWSDGDYKDAK